MRSETEKRLFTYSVVSVSCQNNVHADLKSRNLAPTPTPKANMHTFTICKKGQRKSDDKLSIQLEMFVSIFQPLTSFQ